MESSSASKIGAGQPLVKLVGSNCCPSALWWLVHCDSQVYENLAIVSEGSGSLVVHFCWPEGVSWLRLEVVSLFLCYGWKTEAWGDVLKNGSCRGRSYPGVPLMEVTAGSLVHDMAVSVVSSACLQACICMLELMTPVSSVFTENWYSYLAPAKLKMWLFFFPEQSCEFCVLWGL